MNRKLLVPAAIGLALGVALPLLLMLAPPLRVLNHEFTQLFTCLSFDALLFLSAGIARRVDPSLTPMVRMHTGLTRSLLAAAALGGATLAVMAIANHSDCKFISGVGFYWVTWIPAAAVACVLGVMAGERGWSRRRLLLIMLALVVCDGIYDALQFHYSPRIVDLFVGKPLCFDIRAPMTIPLVHWWQRGLVLAWSVALWELAVWRRCRGQGSDGERALARTARDRGALLAVVLLLVMVLGGGHVGSGLGRRALHQTLTEELHTPHFHFRYPPGGEAEVNIGAIARHAEWCRARIAADWGLEESDKPVKVYVFNGRKGLSRHTNTGAPNAVADTISISADRATGTVMYHELVHILEFRLGGDWLASLHRGPVEGLAEAYEDDLAFHPSAHAHQAAAFRTGTLPSAMDLMSLTGFFTIHEGNAYDAAGSFVGYLILEYGARAYLDFQQDLDYERVYGVDLETLDQGWREFLGWLPEDLESQAWVRDSYDPAIEPGYWEEACPKVGRRRPKPEKLANSKWSAGDVAGAQAIYAELYAEDPQPRWAKNRIHCLRRMGKHQEALAVADEALSAPGLEPADRFNFLQLRINALMALGEWAQLSAAMAERDTLQEPSRERQMIGECFADASLQEGVAVALTDPDWYRRRRTLEVLASDHPDNEALQYLHLTRVNRHFTWGTMGVRADARQAIDEFFALLERSPGAADHWAPSLLDTADVAMRAGDLDLAEEVCGGLGWLVEEPLNRLRTERCLQRVAWETRQNAPAEPR